MTNREFIPPFQVIPMPLNAAGQGPAGEHETVQTVYQVWDSCNCTVSEWPTEAEAIADMQRIDTASWK